MLHWWGSTTGNGVRENRIPFESVAWWPAFALCSPANPQKRGYFRSKKGNYKIVTEWVTIIFILVDKVIELVPKKKKRKDALGSGALRISTVYSFDQSKKTFVEKKEKTITIPTIHLSIESSWWVVLQMRQSLKFDRHATDHRTQIPLWYNTWFKGTGNRAMTIISDQWIVSAGKKWYT